MILQLIVASRPLPVVRDDREQPLQSQNGRLTRRTAKLILVGVSEQRNQRMSVRPRRVHLAGHCIFTTIRPSILPASMRAKMSLMFSSLSQEKCAEPLRLPAKSSASSRS